VSGNKKKAPKVRGIGDGQGNLLEPGSEPVSSEEESVVDEEELTAEDLAAEEFDDESE
jgi:hypothetical protein